MWAHGIDAKSTRDEAQDLSRAWTHLGEEMMAQSQSGTARQAKIHGWIGRDETKCFDSGLCPPSFALTDGRRRRTWGGGGGIWVRRRRLSLTLTTPPGGSGTPLLPSIRALALSLCGGEEMRGGTSALQAARQAGKRGDRSKNSPEGPSKEETSIDRIVLFRRRRRHFATSCQGQSHLQSPNGGTFGVQSILPR